MTSGHPTPPRPVRAGRGLLAALVGVLLVLAAVVVGAVPAAAQNAVGASTPTAANTVGSPAGISAGQRLGNTAPQPQIVVATAVAAKSGTELRRVGDVLESVDDVMANPSLLAGRHPALVENILKDTPGWQVETLGRGSQAGRGWVFRQYTDAGNPTGLQLRWHPGGGHHGPDPYWRVIGPNGDRGGIIR